MANYEIKPGTTGNGFLPTNANQIRRSPKKHWRLGNKKVRLFLIEAGATISETIAVRNGRKAEVFPINIGVLNLNVVTVTPTSSGVNTSYAVADATQTWTGKQIGLMVEIG